MLITIISGRTMVVRFFDVCHIFGKYRAEGVDFASSLVPHGRKVELNFKDTAKSADGLLEQKAGNFQQSEPNKSFFL
jgi:hypothetical protein